jgi:hypothetical protein
MADHRNTQRWKNEIQPIILKRCASCHTSIPALPNLTKFEVIKGLAITDGAVDISSLTRISHIHLFGIAFIFFFVGLIFSLAVGFNKWLKATIIFIPFAFLILDVSAWWLTRIDPAFAWLVIIGGFCYYPRPVFEYRLPTVHYYSMPLKFLNALDLRLPLKPLPPCGWLLLAVFCITFPLLLFFFSPLIKIGVFLGVDTKIIIAL